MINNQIYLGDCIDILKTIDTQSIHLALTSPPYYNAKPEYSIYADYSAYLDFLKICFIEVYRVLKEGRFIAINTSPVIVPRENRNKSSQRLGIPFDLHSIICDIGFEFIDDIVWVKPSGTGIGRGRRFSIDRQPLQYKPTPVTEYVMIYRKQTDKLIDWNIKQYNNIEQSLIEGFYADTNIWEINPAHSLYHPAIFPDELVRRIIEYYSFMEDIVIDPFAGIGTVGKICNKLNRKFILIEKNKKYFEYMRRELSQINLFYQTGCQVFI